MIIPTKLYQALPYIYLSLSLLFLKSHSGYLQFCALLFYTVATIIFVNRSAFRRKDKRLVEIGNWPTTIYEYYPYLMLASGVFITHIHNEITVNYLGWVLIAISLRHLACRRFNRFSKKHRGKF